MARTLSPHRSDIRHWQSTLLSKVTHTASETAAYEFTTLTVSLLEYVLQQIAD